MSSYRTSQFMNYKALIQGQIQTLSSDFGIHTCYGTDNNMKLMNATIGRIQFLLKSTVSCENPRHIRVDLYFTGAYLGYWLLVRVPGTSLRTGKSGLIPSLYATPIESPPVAFPIYYVGTTSVSHHRGGNVSWTITYGQEYKNLRTKFLPLYGFLFQDIFRK